MALKPKAWSETQITEQTAEYTGEELATALEKGGYATEGFAGETIEEYQKWYSGEYGTDPFELTAAGANIKLPEGEVSLDWIASSKAPGFDPETGRFTSLPEPGQEAAFELAESRYAEKQRRESYRQGEATMSWLLGQAMHGDVQALERMMPVAMAQAGAQMGRQFGTGDYSGLMAQRFAEAEKYGAGYPGGAWGAFGQMMPQLMQIASMGAGGRGGGGGGGGGGWQGPLDPYGNPMGTAY